MVGIKTANAHNGHSWYYTLEQVDQLYEKHYNRESKLENAVYFKDGIFFAYVDVDEKITIEVPPSFLANIMIHLIEGLEKGWFRYIFWPDLNHGHVFISEELKIKYNKLDWKDYFNSSLNDKKLGILYHAAEHFCNLDPANKGYIKTRNIIGWFDGRPVELTAPKPGSSPGRVKANTAGVPDGYANVWFINVSASKTGLFCIFDKVHNKYIRLDLSFSISDIYDSTTEEERTIEGRETLKNANPMDRY